MAKPIDNGNKNNSTSYTEKSWTVDWGGTFWSAPAAMNPGAKPKFASLDSNDFFYITKTSGSIDYSPDSSTLAPTINGGKGADQIILQESSTDISDDFFAATTSVEVLKLYGATEDKNEVNLGGKAHSAGIREVSGADSDDTITFDPTAYGSTSVKVSGGAGDDRITTGNGNDTITGGAGADVIDGGLGNDTASYASSGQGVAVDLNDATQTGADGGDEVGDQLISIENLIGSAFADTLTGDGEDNIITGGAGADVLAGGTGTNTFVFAAGDAGKTATTIDVITDFGTGTSNVFKTGVAGSSTNYVEVDGGDIETDAVLTLAEATTVAEAALSGLSGGAQQFAVVTNKNLNGADTDVNATLTYVMIDWNGDDTVDSVIQLTGVTDLSTIAFGSFIA